MKIVFMGTPDFASAIEAHLIETGHTIVAVVTQPDRPAGRKKEPMPSPVKVEALKHGIPVLQPEKVRDPKAIEAIRAYEPDMIVVAAFGQIIPAELLEMPRYGCLNVHASLLPAYRGASPIQMAILDGCSETGITIMKMDRGLDTGDIISQVTVPITEETTGGELFDRLSEAGCRLLAETVDDIEAGRAFYTAQPKESPTPYASLIKKEDGRLNWQEEAVSLERRVRAMNPWPSAFTRVDGKLLKIWKAHVEKPELEGEPGLIVRQDRKGIYIQTGRGLLCLDEVQLEGRKRMSVSEFVRGYLIRNNRLDTK